MLLLYNNVVCPSCKAPHDLWTDEPGSRMIIPPHDFVCPTTGQRTTWRPNVFAHPVKSPPKEAIPLMPHILIDEKPISAKHEQE